MIPGTRAHELYVDHPLSCSSQCWRSGEGAGKEGVVGGRGIVAMALHGVSNMQIACGSLRFFAFNECPAYSTHELDVCESLCVCVYV